MTLGKKIKYLREKNSMTQKRLAELLNLTQQAIGKWEKDINEPDSKALIKLSEIFNCSVDFLLNKTDNPTPYQVSAEDKELTPKERLKELFKHPKLKDKELAFKNFDAMDDEDIESIIEYIEARYLLAEKRKNDNKD
ncbi:MAG: helix-turn-helix domain-containing protein [Eubacteriaceae bacterium]